MHNKTLTMYITRRDALQQVLLSCYFPPVVLEQVDGTYNKLEAVTKFTVVKNFNYKVMNSHIPISLKQFTPLPLTFMNKYAPPSNKHTHTLSHTHIRKRWFMDVVLINVYKKSQL